MGCSVAGLQLSTLLLHEAESSYGGWDWGASPAAGPGRPRGRQKDLGREALEREKVQGTKALEAGEALTYLIAPVKKQKQGTESNLITVISFLYLFRIRIQQMQKWKINRHSVKGMSTALCACDRILLLMAAGTVIYCLLRCRFLGYSRWMFMEHFSWRAYTIGSLFHWAFVLICLLAGRFGDSEHSSWFAWAEFICLPVDL